MLKKINKRKKINDYWRQQCEAAVKRIELVKSEEKRHKMREACANYNRIAFTSMDDEQIMEFAKHQACGATAELRIKDIGGQVRRMTEEEVDDYSIAVYSSIVYFNKRSSPDILREQTNNAAEKSRVKNTERTDYIIHIPR